MKKPCGALGMKMIQLAHGIFLPLLSAIFNIANPEFCSGGSRTAIFLRLFPGSRCFLLTAVKREPERAGMASGGF